MLGRGSIARARKRGQPGPKLGPSPAQPGPSLAQARCLGTWKSGNLESKKFQKSKFSKSKSVLPKMSARSRLVGEISSWPNLGPFQTSCSMGRKNSKIVVFFFAYFPWWAKGRYSTALGQWAVFTRFGNQRGSGWQSPSEDPERK